MKMTWKLLKEIVKELRIKQNRLMKKQGGLNEVMVTISILEPYTYRRIVFYPHGLNMTTGNACVTVDGESKTVNIKGMLVL